MGTLDKEGGASAPRGSVCVSDFELEPTCVCERMEALSDAEMK